VIERMERNLPMWEDKIQKTLEETTASLIHSN